MSNLSIFIMLKLLISFVFCCPMSLKLNGIVSIHKATRRSILGSDGMTEFDCSLAL